MKVTTKETSRTIVDKITVFMAMDGTEFQYEDECKKYEQSAECVLKSKINKFQVSCSSECSIYGAGSDDYNDVVYYPQSQQEKDILLHYYFLKEGENGYNIEKLKRDLEKNDVHYIIGEDYNGDLYYIGTVEDHLTWIKNQLLGIDITKNPA